MKKERLKPLDYGTVQEVRGSEYCLYSVIENKLRTLSHNQKVLDKKLDRILEVLEQLPPVY